MTTPSSLPDVALLVSNQDVMGACLPHPGYQGSGAQHVLPGKIPSWQCPLLILGHPSGVCVLTRLHLCPFNASSRGFVFTSLVVEELLCQFSGWHLGFLCEEALRIELSVSKSAVSISVEALPLCKSVVLSVITGPVVLASPGKWLKIEILKVHPDFVWDSESFLQALHTLNNKSTWNTSSLRFWDHRAL